MDCGTKYYEMVLNGDVTKFNFRCRDCSGEGIPMFGRKKKKKNEKTHKVDACENASKLAFNRWGT